MFRCILSFIKWFTPTCSTTMSVEAFAKWISIQWRISFDVASRKLTIFEFPLEMKLLNSLRQIPFGMMSVTNKICFFAFLGLKYFVERFCTRNHSNKRWKTCFFFRVFIYYTKRSSVFNFWRLYAFNWTFRCCIVNLKLFSIKTYSVWFWKLAQYVYWTINELRASLLVSFLFNDISMMHRWFLECRARTKKVL